MKVANIEPGQHLDAALRYAYGAPGYAPTAVLFEAVRQRQIALTILFCNKLAWSPRALPNAGPRVVLIADDAGNSRDPGEWRSSMSVIAWSRAAVVHGTGGKAEHYAAAVEMAKATGRVVMVETDSAHAAGWQEAIAPRGITCLAFIPPPGCVHPAPVTTR